MQAKVTRSDTLDHIEINGTVTPCDRGESDRSLRANGFEFRSEHETGDGRTVLIWVRPGKDAR